MSKIFGQLSRGKQTNNMCSWRTRLYGLNIINRFLFIFSDVFFYISFSFNKRHIHPVYSTQQSDRWHQMLPESTPTFAQIFLHLCSTPPPSLLSNHVLQNCSSPLQASVHEPDPLTRVRISGVVMRGWRCALALGKRKKKKEQFPLAIAWTIERVPSRSVAICSVVIVYCSGSLLFYLRLRASCYSNHTRVSRETAIYYTPVPRRTTTLAIAESLSGV